MTTLVRRALGSPRARCSVGSNLPLHRAYSVDGRPTRSRVTGARGAPSGPAACRASYRPRTGREGRPPRPYVVGPRGGTLPSARMKAYDALDTPRVGARESSESVLPKPRFGEVAVTAKVICW